MTSPLPFVAFCLAVKGMVGRAALSMNRADFSNMSFAGMRVNVCGLIFHCSDGLAHGRRFYVDAANSPLPCLRIRPMKLKLVLIQVARVAWPRDASKNDSNAISGPRNQRLRHLQLPPAVGGQGRSL
ncbi:hypothetical protein LIA77_05427 [Sarocladium implicatum]|nr:hypothetical protein LIA77_05427 [Sarocladium implicatum]